MKKYIHIGYPKNLSTTLQRDFFPNHPDILHLGVGINSNIDYIDDSINVICEDYLLYANERKYQSVKPFVKESFAKYLENDFDGKKVVGISAELLSFKFSPDHIDSATKAERLYDIFGGDTVILIIIRNQWELLKSLYREVIKIGYPDTFHDFIEYIFYYQDRNFALDFCYDQTLKLYAELFGKEKVKILPIEKVRDTNGGLIRENNKNLLVSWLCSSLSIPYNDIELSHYNEPLTSEGLHHKMILNREFKHDLGLPMYNSVNGHRLVKYFSDDLKVPLPKVLHSGLHNKRSSIDKASTVYLSNKSAREIDYFADPFILRRLQDLYNKSNESLAKLGVDLTPEYVLSSFS